MAFTGLKWSHIKGSFNELDKTIDAVSGMIWGERKSLEGGDGGGIEEEEEESEKPAIVAAAGNNAVLCLKRKKGPEASEEDCSASLCKKPVASRRASVESVSSSLFASLSGMLSSNTIKKQKNSGIDSWAPENPLEIAEIPKNLHKKYKKVYPNVTVPKKFALNDGDFTVLTCLTKSDKSSEEVAECSDKSDISEKSGQLSFELSEKDDTSIRESKPLRCPSDLKAKRISRRSEGRRSQSESGLIEKEKKAKEEEKKDPLHHLAVTFWSKKDETRVLSLYRSTKMSDAVALCERCRENSGLFKCIPKDGSVREKVNKIFHELRENMTWKSIHIACKLGLIEYLKNMKEEKIEKNYSVIAQPQGKSPIMIAIQHNQLEVVRYMIEKGADLNYTCLDGSTVLHIAALTSVEMCELLWKTEKCGEMINKADSFGNSPAYVALTNGYLSIARYLKNIGGNLTAADAPQEATPLIGAIKRGKIDEPTITKILEMKPDALKEVEETTGNSIIHCVTNKKTIMLLLSSYEKDVDPTVRNKSKQTALHIFVSRGDISLVMTICAYGVDVNVEDCNGNTPLHLAVTNGNVDITRVLLCLGANPNKVNHYKETPRHIAAKNGDREKAMELVRSLIICGAKTCPKGFVGCAFGCMHRDVLGACRKYINSGKAEDVAQANVESHVNEASVNRDATTAPYEFVLDPDTHVVEEAYAERNDVRSYPHRMALKRVKDKLKMISESDKPSNVINVLALDGGGIRGLVTVQMLLSLEKLLEEPLINYFDWIGATSTGSYIMSTLLTGQSLRQAQYYYLQFKDQLFDCWSRPYDTNILESFIKQCFGENKMMSDISYPRVFTTTVRADTFPVQLDLCRSYWLPISKQENEDLGFTDPKEMPLWKACRRSSAAPTYFSASEGKYIDGGMISNNPTLDLLSEICFWNTTCEKSNYNDKLVDVGCVLSVGTGITPVCPVDPTLFEMSNFMGVLRGIMNLSLVVIDQATATEGAPITRSRSWCHSLGYPYYRLNAPLFKDVFLDANDDLELSKIMWDTVVYSHTHRKDFEEVADLLKKVGTNKKRRKFLKI